MRKTQRPHIRFAQFPLQNLRGPNAVGLFGRHRRDTIAALIAILCALALLIMTMGCAFSSIRQEPQYRGDTVQEHQAIIFNDGTFYDIESGKAGKVGQENLQGAQGGCAGVTCPPGERCVPTSDGGHICVPIR